MLTSRSAIACLALSLLLPACSTVVDRQASGSTSGTSTSGTSASSTASSGTSATAMVCAPGAEQSCACPGGAGHSVCLPDGSAFGPCEACELDVPWSKGFDDPTATAVAQVLVAPDDSVVATILWYVGGNDPRSTIQKMDPSGNVVWSRDAPGRLVAQAFDENGNVVVSGWNFDLDLGQLEGIEPCSASVNEEHACVVLGKLDPWTGALVWSRTYLSTSNLYARIDVAGVTPDGRIGVVGTFSYDLDLGGTGPLMDVAGDGAAFVALLSSDGSAVWARTIDDANDMLGAIPASAALGADGSLVVTGEVRNQLDFGSGVVESETDGLGFSPFVAEYGPSGELRFGKVLGSEASFDGEGPSVAFDGEGHVFFTVQATGQFDLGAGVIGDTGVARDVLAKLDAAGQPVWSTFFATSTDMLEPFTVTADAAGNAWLCGGSTPMLTFGGTTVPYAGHPDPLLLELSGAGTPLSTREFPGSGWQRGAQVAFGKPGVVVVTGNLQQSIDFGQGPLVSASGDGAFIAKLGP